MTSTLLRCLTGSWLWVAAGLSAGQAQALGFSERLAARASEAPVLIQAHAPLRLKATEDVRDSVIERLVMSGALEMIGTEYTLGADSNEAVDCSALMQRIYRTAGLDLPRTARDQQEGSKPVRLAELKQGDLLFYRWQRRALHVAIYMDNGYILHASSGKGRVVMTRLNASWRKRLVSVRRPL